MRRRLLLALGIVVGPVLLAAAAGAAYAYHWERTHRDAIARGVTIASVDVGGLHAAQARALLDARLRARLGRPVTVVDGAHRFTIRPARNGLRIATARMVADAVALSRRGGLLHRLLRDVRGRRLRRDLPLRADISADRVAAFVDRVARILDRPAVSARVVPRPLALGLRIVPERTGLAVKRPLLERRLANALLALDGRRTVAVPTRPVHPRWTRKTLTRRYDTYLLVSRETFTLRLYKRLRLVRTYRIAVGRQGLETPAGLYAIDDKQVDPSWHVPLSAWAGDLAGRVIPPGPDDPIKARWLGFYDGAGIHGTDETWSIGSAASHGCIRMTIPDVEDLYPRVPLHTPIYVG
jgi:hypothetical protein